VPSDRPFPNSYWVLPNRFLAGEYPGLSTQVQARQKIRRLLQENITFFLDLTEEGELQPYTPILREEDFMPFRVAEYRRMPIIGLSTPTQAEMTRILDTIDTALAADEAVYVHCWAGIGRTGTVVGCYLVRHGLSGTQALENIAELRRDMPNGWLTSPETETQCQMILNWSEQSEPIGEG